MTFWGRMDFEERSRILKKFWKSGVLERWSLRKNNGIRTRFGMKKVSNINLLNLRKERKMVMTKIENIKEEEKMYEKNMYEVLVGNRTLRVREKK